LNKSTLVFFGDHNVLCEQVFFELHYKHRRRAFALIREGAPITAEG
jgi:hypothetical protein